jgi:hypothetical protein
MEERSNSEGAHRKGADDGDARAESGTEKGFRWWKAGEVDAWAMGEACAALGCGRARRTVRGGRKRSTGGRWLLLRGGGGQQRGGVHADVLSCPLRDTQGLQVSGGSQMICFNSSAGVTL